jgi:hypothetical protein
MRLYDSLGSSGALRTAKSNIQRSGESWYVVFNDMGIRLLVTIVGRIGSLFLCAWPFMHRSICKHIHGWYDASLTVALFLSRDKNVLNYAR